MMTNILNKTFNLAVSSLSNKSDELVDTNTFIQAIEHVENKPEHICRFLNHLKQSFSSLSPNHQYKYLTVLVYCAHLSNENSAIKECVLGFGGIVTTFIDQSKDVCSKKLGYLALAALVNLESSEIVYLAVNTILKDITCNNKGFIMVSLDAVCQLVTTDLVPVLIPVVEQRLGYKDAAVRIRAFRALECIYKVGPEFVNNSKKHVKLALSDYSPEVMASALPHLHRVVKVCRCDSIRKMVLYSHLLRHLLFAAKNAIHSSAAALSLSFSFCAPGKFMFFNHDEFKVFFVTF